MPSSDRGARANFEGSRRSLVFCDLRPMKLDRFHLDISVAGDIEVKSRSVD